MTIAHQLKHAERELALRMKVYPKWVESGRKTGEEAQAGIDGMTAIVATLQRQKYLSEISDEMRGYPLP